MNKLKNFTHTIFIKSGFLGEVAFTLIGAAVIISLISLLGLIVNFIFPSLPLQTETPYLAKLLCVGIISFSSIIPF